MNVYECLCDEEKFKKMCSVLNHYETEHSEAFYYDIRNKDRNKNSYNRLSCYTKAARTIYLNKACFNGLYRVNSKNEFNVPFGKKLKVNTYDGGNLITVSNYLTMNDIKILCVDFEDAVKSAKKVILYILIRHMILIHLHLIVIQKMALVKKNRED